MKMMAKRNRRNERRLIEEAIEYSQCGENESEAKMAK
jgi:hypothetical protein